MTRNTKARKYTYMPGVANSVLVSRNAPHGGDVRVELQVSESLLREFLTLLEALQEELNQRWGNQEGSDCRADRV